MVEDRGLGIRAFRVVNVLIMIFLILIAAYPLYFVLSASISDGTALMKNSGALLAPLKPYTLDAYRRVLSNRMIMQGYKNTAFVLTMGVAINLIMTVMGAYFLSIKRIRLGGVIMFLILFTRYFGGGLVPDYLNIRSLGLLDTLWALVLPGAVASYNLIIMRTAFTAVPESLSESARLDGAKHYRILISIMVPLCAPTIAVIVLYYAVGHWNAWFSASIYLRTRSLYPLQLIMREILIMSQMSDMVGAEEMGDAAMINELIKYALIVIGTAPILALYPFLQRYFIKGVMIGAVKG